MASTPYDSAFYANQHEGARRSAAVIVPLVMDLLRPASVLDVGCGVGAWLSVFRSAGVDDILGVDGGYVDRAALLIDGRSFLPHDLRRRLDLGRSFDLAVSLEVAEHLPHENAAGFVASLVRHAPAVLFSAAIPFQGGTDHVNEQWQDYWAGLFAAHEYVTIDCVRRHVWSEPNVCWWYAQNTLLYARADYVAARPRLAAELEHTTRGSLRLVHPSKYLDEVDPSNGTVRSALGRLRHSLSRAVVRRLASR